MNMSLTPEPENEHEEVRVKWREQIERGCHQAQRGELIDVPPGRGRQATKDFLRSFVVVFASPGFHEGARMRHAARIKP